MREIVIALAILVPYAIVSDLDFQDYELTHHHKETTREH